MDKKYSLNIIANLILKTKIMSQFGKYYQKETEMSHNLDKRKNSTFKLKRIKLSTKDLFRFYRTQLIKNNKSQFN
jgi:hypothetical protein